MENQYPASLGSVTYLTGNPGAQALAAAASALLGNANLEDAIRCFRENLQRAGRPAQPGDIDISYGQSVADLLTAGIALQGVPWRTCSWFQGCPLPMFEGHGGEGAGWWAEVAPKVLLHARFDGRNGLDGLHAARLLAESPTPAAVLVAWLDQLLADNQDFFMEDVLAQMPAELTQCLGYCFLSGLRVVSLGMGGTEQAPCFHVYEQDRR